MAVVEEMHWGTSPTRRENTAQIIFFLSIIFHTLQKHLLYAMEDAFRFKTTTRKLNNASLSQGRLKKKWKCALLKSFLHRSLAFHNSPNSQRWIHTELLRRGRMAFFPWITFYFCKIVFSLWHDSLLFLTTLKCNTDNPVNCNTMVSKAHVWWHK